MDIHKQNCYLLIKFFVNNFCIVEIIFNIVSGNLFPVLTNPSI